MRTMPTPSFFSVTKCVGIVLRATSKHFFLVTHTYTYTFPTHNAAQSFVWKFYPFLFSSYQTIITATSCALCTHKSTTTKPNSMLTLPNGNNNNNENISVEKVIKSSRNVILASFAIRMLLNNTD